MSSTCFFVQLAIVLWHDVAFRDSECQYGGGGLVGNVRHQHHHSLQFVQRGAFAFAGDEQGLFKRILHRQLAQFGGWKMLRHDA